MATDSFGRLLTETRDFDTLEAWEVLLPTAQATREVLREEQLTPIDVAILTEHELDAWMLEKEITHYAVKTKLRRVRRFVRKQLDDTEARRQTEQGPGTPQSVVTAEDTERRDSPQPHGPPHQSHAERTRKPPKFTLPLPKAEGVPIVKFLHSFSHFLLREQIEDGDIYSTLLLCIPDNYLKTVADQREILEGKPWRVIQSQVRQILEPAKSTAHYMHEFMTLNPGKRETIQDYQLRFNEYTDLLGLDTPELTVNTYLNSLPPDWRRWIRTIQAARGSTTFESLEEIQGLIAQRFDDPTIATFEKPSMAKFESKSITPLLSASTSRWSTGRSLAYQSAHQAPNKRDMPCYYCGKEGHFEFECRK